MLPDDGKLVAPPEVSPMAWTLALPAARHPLVLAPTSDRGWFGGTTLVAVDPASADRANGKEAIDAVGDALERAMRSKEPVLTAVVLDYEGTASIVSYEGGLLLTGKGWRVWGTLDADSLPEPGENRTPAPDAPLIAAPRRGIEMRTFTRAVGRVRQAVEDGDVYVMNLTYRLRGTPLVSPAEMFAALADRGAGDMTAALIGSDRSILSVSPERFLSVHDGYASIQPIKGTRPRGMDEEGDARYIAELAESAKESAEHVMVVDMERNDLGRVCVPGSVQVDPLKEIVTTPYCHQMVSTVTGYLRNDVPIADVLRATFPCGSVTGAPKVSAMEHITAFERSPRGAYCGSLLVAVPGELDSSVLIRTAEINTGVLRYGTGGGITFESDPHEEWLETLVKTVPLTGDSAPAVALQETCRVVRGCIPLWPRHKARLGSGGCGPSLLARVDAKVADTLCSARTQADYARLTVIVSPNGHVRVGFDEDPSSLHVQGGPSYQMVYVAGAPEVPEGAAKPADREHWDAAMREAREADADQAILTDSENNVIDGGTASVWVAFGERVFTPPAPPAIAGVARGLVLDLGRSVGLRPEVAHVRAKDLFSADEVIFTNALGGAVAAFGRRGAATEKMEQLFREVWETGEET